jgi:hypothetical protein
MSITLINLIILIAPIIFITCIIFFLGDNMNYKKLKQSISEIIYIANFIQNIETAINYITYENNLDKFTDIITSDTKLRYNQYVFLHYIERLEIIQDKWDYYNNNKLFNNSNITCPYIVAYQIREVLNLPIDGDVWFNKDERECLKNNKDIVLAEDSDSD